MILDYREPELKAIGFILPNQSSSLPIETYAVLEDRVEDATGLGFFYLLEDTEEKALESQVQEFKDLLSEYRKSLA